MGILLFIVLGIVAGFLARAIMPGRQSMSVVMTALLGMAGSFVGGFVANLFSNRSFFALNSSGLIGSVIGSLVILAIMTYAGRRRALT